jgi:hypothetical protein
MWFQHYNILMLIQCDMLKLAKIITRGQNIWYNYLFLLAFIVNIWPQKPHKWHYETNNSEYGTKIQETIENGKQTLIQKFTWLLGKC